MGVIRNKHDFTAYTPICESCGIRLCWDISVYEYLEDREFWEAWTCKDCGPKKSLRQYREHNEQKKFHTKQYSGRSSHKG